MVNQRGMSLIEVMVALLVSAIGLFGTLALLGTILKGGDFSRRLTEASVLAQYKLEELEVMQPPFPADNPNCPTPTSPTLIPLPTVTTQDATPVNPLGQPIPPGTGMPYTRWWAWCTSIDGLGRRVVYVTVQWNDSITAVTQRPHQVVVRRERNL